MTPTEKYEKYVEKYEKSYPHSIESTEFLKNSLIAIETEVRKEIGEVLQRLTKDTEVGDLDQDIFHYAELLKGNITHQR